MTDNRKERTDAMVLAKTLVRRIYARHGAGCCWHVVLDDGNTTRSIIDHSAETAGECGYMDCKALGELASLLSCTQFRKLSRTLGEEG